MHLLGSKGQRFRESGIVELGVAKVSTRTVESYFAALKSLRRAGEPFAHACVPESEVAPVQNGMGGDYFKRFMRYRSLRFVRRLVGLS